MVAASSCDECSPQCLGCRLHGFTRLSPDKSLAECFLQANPVGGFACPPLGEVGSGTAQYIGRLVCLQQRCALSKGERCKLIRLNEDTCNYLVSSANSALNSDLSGCTSYLKVGDSGQCLPGYTPYCAYSGVPDALPAAKPLPGNTSLLDMDSIYSAIPDVLALTQYVTANPSGINGDPCKDTITDKHGNKLQKVFEGCVPVTGRVIGTPFAGILANGECDHRHQKLIVQGMAGCYHVKGSNLLCNIGFKKAGNVSGQMLPAPHKFVPQCYYRLANKDNDPSGCQGGKGHSE